METQPSTVDAESSSERYYRREQACEAMRISLSTLQRAIRSGEIKIRRTRGGIVWIAQSEIDKYNRLHPLWIQPPLDGVDDTEQTLATPIEDRPLMTDEGVSIAARLRARARGKYGDD